MHGYSENVEIPLQSEYSAKSEETAGDKSAFSHFMPRSLFLACENGLAFTQRILHHQMYVPLTLDAQELWAPERQLKLSADMLIFTICILYVYYMYTICILYVYYVYIICMLYLYMYIINIL